MKTKKLENVFRKKSGSFIWKLNSYIAILPLLEGICLFRLPNSLQFIHILFRMYPRRALQYLIITSLDLLIIICMSYSETNCLSLKSTKKK